MSTDHHSGSLPLMWSATPHNSQHRKPYETRMSTSPAVKVPRKALADSALLRYITFAVLYFSQGIPEGMTIFAIPA